MIDYEEEVNLALKTNIIVKDVKFKHDFVTVKIKKYDWKLYSARLIDFKAKTPLFVIDKLNLDIDTDESYFIRHITGKNYIEIEKFELEKAYFTRNSSLNLSENIFPEINKKAYKYTYSFVRSISQNSTRYSIIQLEKQVTPINLTLEKIVSLCKWDGCLVPIMPHAKITINKNGIRIRESSSKKKLNEKSKNSLQIRKKKVEENAMHFLCLFHHKLKCFSNLPVNLTTDNPPELWKAVKGGLNWRESITPNSKLWTYINTAKDEIENYFNMPLDSYDIQNQSSSSLSKDSPKTDLTVKLKIKKDIEELIKQKDIEIAITEELRKCISAETSNNLVTGKNQFQTYQDLKETLTINDSWQKLYKLRALREKYENSYYNPRTDPIRPSSQRASSRPSSAIKKQNERRNTTSDPISDLKEINQKILTSPYYASQQRVTSALKRIRLPKGSGKVCKVKSLGVLDKSKVDPKYL